MKDYFDTMTAESEIRWEKQKQYINLAKRLGDSIQFDGQKATIYIRAQVEQEKEVGKNGPRV